jgi:hypothetical protein
MVAIVSFEVKVKGEHRNFALGKISPKGKFRSSPSPKNQKLKPLTNRGTMHGGRRGRGILTRITATYAIAYDA